MTCGRTGVAPVSPLPSQHPQPGHDALRHHSLWPPRPVPTSPQRIFGSQQVPLNLRLAG